MNKRLIIIKNLFRLTKFLILIKNKIILLLINDYKEKKEKIYLKFKNVQFVVEYC